MLSNYEMSSVCVDVGVMWRLSEDLNRRFAARVQQHHHHHPHHMHHRPGPVSMIYNGIFVVWINENEINFFNLSFCARNRHSISSKFNFVFYLKRCFPLIRQCFCEMIWCVHFLDEQLALYMNHESMKRRKKKWKWKFIEIWCWRCAVVLFLTFFLSASDEDETKIVLQCLYGMKKIMNRNYMVWCNAGWILSMTVNSWKQKFVR